MANDYKYEVGDRPMTNGRYDTTTGKWAAMIREMVCPPMDVLGVTYGNRFWSTKRRMLDEADKAEARRHFEVVALRYSRPGWITDIQIDVGVPSSGKGSTLAVRVSGFDTMEQKARESSLPVSGVF